MVKTHLISKLIPKNVCKNWRFFIKNLLSRTDDYRNLKRQSAAARLVLPGIRGVEKSTSASDYLEYRQIVTAAARDDKVFKLFRSHPHYSPILEHVSRRQGAEYLDIIFRRSNLPENWSKKCAPLNTLGKPPKYSYASIGRFSPTVLRYLKVFSDLEALFGPLQGFRCVEIGVGFGGQAAVLNILGDVTEVQLYDLSPVLALARKFLAKASVSAGTRFLDGARVPQAHQADLLISNYAFSELTRELQLKYLDKVVLNAPRGYITWNSNGPGGLQPEELLKLIPGAKRLEENPKTGQNNVIIVWGTDRDLGI